MGETSGAGDAHYRLGALHCRLAIPPTEVGEAGWREKVGGAFVEKGKQREAAAAAASHRVAVAHHHFSRALAYLTPGEHPVDHLLVRLALVRLHKRVARHLAPSASPAIAELSAALRELLATHQVFSCFSFPLPHRTAKSEDHLSALSESPPSSLGRIPELPEGRMRHSGCTHEVGRGGVAKVGGSSTCALVASLWPVVESELHWLLKELVRLHEMLHRVAEVSLFKELFRLSLTQRQLLGNAMLLQLSEEWARVERDWQATGARKASGAVRRKGRGLRG